MVGRPGVSWAIWGVVAVIFLAGLSYGMGAVSAEAGVQPQAGYDPVVAALIGDVSLGRLYTDLYALQNFSTRYTFSTGIVGASQYIFDRFAENSNLQVAFQDFTYQGTPVRNVLAVLPGTDPTNETLYILGAHYDSITLGPGADPMNWAPGADDDGSGTVGVMEAARVMSAHRFNATLVFAAWTAEELGLVGSDYYCTCLAGLRGDVGLYLNMDMIGNDPLDFQGIEVIHDLPSEWAADAFLTLVSDYGLGLWPTKSFNTSPNSDHASFWAQGYPAIFLAETDFSPNWHRPTDTIDNVNMNLITNTTKGAVGLLATLAGVQDPAYGALFFEQSAFPVPGGAGLVLTDADLNADPGFPESVVVSATSPQEPAGEAVVLLETAPDTGAFRGAVPLGTAPAVPGELQVAPGATITASYTDASPPGTRTATARIDGTIPAIRNVAAVPGITTATVAWETSEPADSTVRFGPTPSLGEAAVDPRLSTSHRLELDGLQPDAAYYFDVESSDEAGLLAVADNDGLHYAFHTLTGIVAIPNPGHVGYVRSGGDPRPNFLDSDRMLSGFSAATGRTYRAAAQFDTTGAPFPPVAVLTGGWLDLHAQEWVYTAQGQWTVRYLNDTIDANWASHGYAAIANALVDFALPPTLANADLRPGEWIQMSLPAAQLPAVRDRIATGAVSIRIDGPASGAGSIFAWSTGYPSPCADVPPTHPKLSATYSITGDTEGPAVTALGADPNPTMAAATTALTATVSDAAMGDTPIASVEYFVGADPGPGRGTPMGAADGSFDQPTEDAALELDASAIPFGVYTVWVRGRDRAGNWGAPTSFDLYVGVWDMVPPTVTVWDAPDPASSGVPVTITASVIDDVGVAQVEVAVTNPGGTSTTSFTMTNVGPDYVHTATYTDLGDWTYTVTATDGSGKSGTAQGGFQVEDTSSPAISGLEATPNPGEVFGLVNVSAEVRDPFLDEVTLRIDPPTGAWIDALPAFDSATERFYYLGVFDTVGVHQYSFSARDSSGNSAVASASFFIQDTTAPALSAFPDPPTQTVGALVTIRAQAGDNYALSDVIVEIWDPGNARVAAAAMAYDGGSGAYVHGFRPDVMGTYSYVVTARDSSGNTASDGGMFRSIDAVPPRVDAVFVDPSLAEQSLRTYLGATASDDIGVAGLTFAVYTATGALVGNFSASFHEPSGRWEWTRAYDTGAFDFIAWARDVGGNFGSASGSFAVASVSPEASAGPDQRIERGRAATLNGSGSTDDIGITRWEWTVTGPGGTVVFTTPVVEFTPPALGRYTATLRVWDAGGRMDEDVASLTVETPAPSDTAVADWAWIAAAILVGVLAVVVIARRKKKAEDPPPEGPT